MGETGHRRMVVMMKGGPGSGKSTVARDLGALLDWPLIDKDNVQDLVDGAEAGAVAYETMFSVAALWLEQGLGVIGDSSLLTRIHARSREVAAERGATVGVVEAFWSDETEWERRVGGGNGTPFRVTRRPTTPRSGRPALTQAGPPVRSTRPVSGSARSASGIRSWIGPASGSHSWIQHRCRSGDRSPTRPAPRFRHGLD